MGQGFSVPVAGKQFDSHRAGMVHFAGDEWCTLLGMSGAEMRAPGDYLAMARSLDRTLTGLGSEIIMRVPQTEQ